MAEVHIIGQILGASGFPESSLFCKWKVQMGSAWRVLQGDHEGQTQVDDPSDEPMANWCHPIDLHCATKGLQESFNRNDHLCITLIFDYIYIVGWPKFHLQVWHQDMYGRNELYSYGFCHVPISPGLHEIDCVTWRPKGTLLEELKTEFIGGSSQLKNPDLVSSSAELYKLRTVSMGKIHLRLHIIVRNFDKYGVEF
ncbi:unnamed protein product [Rotaria sp. Silwood2]|nr:unnamed protein product [Rotaria sp. Silwood2]